MLKGKKRLNIGNCEKPEYGFFVGPQSLSVALYTLDTPKVRDLPKKWEEADAYQVHSPTNYYRGTLSTCG
jgi:hypothetical protein